MNFLADESVDRQVVDRLRQDGHAVRYIAEMEPGISDDRVLDLANQEADVLLTADKDQQLVPPIVPPGILQCGKVLLDRDSRFCLLYEAPARSGGALLYYIKSK